MKTEVKKWLGVAVLLFVGFILGRTTILPDVNANPQESEIGRYQLVVGEIQFMETITSYLDESDSSKLHQEMLSAKTLFRIDTVTGDVDQYNGEIVEENQDSLTFRYEWHSITSKWILKLP